MRFLPYLNTISISFASIGLTSRGSSAALNKIEKRIKEVLIVVDVVDAEEYIQSTWDGFSSALRPRIKFIDSWTQEVLFP